MGKRLSQLLAVLTGGACLVSAFTIAAVAVIHRESAAWSREASLERTRRTRLANEMGRTGAALAKIPESLSLPELAGHEAELTKALRELRPLTASYPRIADAAAELVTTTRRRIAAESEQARTGRDVAADVRRSITVSGAVAESIGQSRESAEASVSKGVPVEAVFATLERLIQASEALARVNQHLSGFQADRNPGHLDQADRALGRVFGLLTQSGDSRGIVAAVAVRHLLMRIRQQARGPGRGGSDGQWDSGTGNDVALAAAMLSINRASFVTGVGAGVSSSESIGAISVAILLCVSLATLVGCLLGGALGGRLRRDVESLEERKRLWFSVALELKRKISAAVPALREAARKIAPHQAAARAGTANVAETLRMIAVHAAEGWAAADDAAALTRAASGSASELHSNGSAVAEAAQTIGRIAFRTNVVALNAVIEASHAGGAGAGFGLVAGEVKSLANETLSSAREIDGRANALGDWARGVSEALSGIASVFPSVLSRIRSIQVAITAVADDLGQEPEQVQTDEPAAGAVARQLEDLAGELELSLGDPALAPARDRSGPRRVRARNAEKSAVGSVLSARRSATAAGKRPSAREAAAGRV